MYAIRYFFLHPHKLKVTIHSLTPLVSTALNHAGVSPAAILDRVATIPFPALVPVPSAVGSPRTPRGEISLSGAIPRRGAAPVPLCGLDADGAKLHRSLTKRSLLPTHLVRAAFRTPQVAG